MSTLSSVLACLTLAWGVGVPRRAKLAANLMAVMAITQVRLTSQIKDVTFTFGAVIFRCVLVFLRW